MSRPSSGKKDKEDIDMVYSRLEQGNYGNIYVSSLDAAKNINTLRRLNIKAVISVAKGAFLPHPEVDLPNYMYLPAYDTKDFDISAYFQKTYTFIDKNLGKANVLVHCMAGISRSATIVIAYIIKKHKTKLTQALNLVKGYRPSIHPNGGFLQQLEQYANTQVDRQRAATEQNHQNDRRNYHSTTSPEKRTIEVRRYSMVSASMQRLDQNIEILKNKCLRLEIASKSSTKKRQLSQPRKLSLKNIERRHLSKNENKNLFSIDVPKFELTQNRKP